MLNVEFGDHVRKFRVPWYAPLCFSDTADEPAGRSYTFGELLVDAAALWSQPMEHMVPTVHYSLTTHSLLTQVLEDGWDNVWLSTSCVTSEVCSAPPGHPI